MTKVFSRPVTLTNKQFHYCPGCTHGIVHRLVAEVLVELGLENDAIGIASVGCSVLAYEYFNFD
ncbi:MAG: 2-oxoglutarate oxidoreductase, partial [Bacillota bacterium]|nr:2-oxoglutarate oxidoreductase [Bacillota bacterium]